MSNESDAARVVANLDREWRDRGMSQSEIVEGTFLYLFAPIQCQDELPVHFPLTFSFSEASTRKAAEDYASHRKSVVPPPVVTVWWVRRVLRMAQLEASAVHATLESLEGDSPGQTLRAAVRDWCVSHDLDGIQLLPPPEHRLILVSPREALFSLADDP